MKLSLEQEVLHEVWTIFRRDIAKRTSGNFSRGVHTEMYGVFEVKNRKKNYSASVKCNWKKSIECSDHIPDTPKVSSIQVIAL